MHSSSDLSTYSVESNQTYKNKSNFEYASLIFNVIQLIFVNYFIYIEIRVIIYLNTIILIKIKKNKFKKY
jgi:hypothetical protein